MVRGVSSDESRKLPILNKIFVPCRPAPTIGRESLSSMRSRDHVLHDPTACRLQWPHSASGQEPHAFVFVAAVNNIDAVARDRVMECGAGIFGNESEESFAPWVIGIMEISSPSFFSSSTLIVRMDLAIALRRSLSRLSRSNFSNGIGSGYSVEYGLLGNARDIDEP
jgi:hypothetical protein